MVCSPQNLFLWFSRNRSSFPCIVSNTNFTCIDTKPRAKRVSRCQDIHRNLCAPPAAEETQIQNRPLRPARRSDFGPGRRWRVSRRSGNTNPREERVRISRDIRDARGRSSWSMQEGLTRNPLLRLVRRSDFDPGHRSRVSARSRNTNPRGGKFCRCRNISAARQNNTYKWVHPYFLIQGSTIFSGLKSPSKPCISSAQSEIWWVSAKSFAQF